MFQRFFSFVCNPCGNGILLYTLFLRNISLRTFSSSIFCKTLYYFVIKMITLFIFHICSGALCCLWKIRILLLITFEFWFVWIFLKFLREDIALLTLQKIVLLVLSQCLKRKSGFVEKLLTPMNKELSKVR